VNKEWQKLADITFGTMISGDVHIAARNEQHRQEYRNAHCYKRSLHDSGGVASLGISSIT
jgi:hypothetical protein